MTWHVWLAVALVCPAGSALLFCYAVKLGRGSSSQVSWIWGDDDEAQGHWVPSTLIAPKAELPEGYELPSTAPILDNSQASSG